MDRFAGVLLEMQPGDADGAGRPVLKVDFDLTLSDNWIEVLRYLVPLRQIRVEIILPVEDGFQIDLRVETETGTHRLFNRFFVDHRQHAGHGRVDQ